MACLDDNTVVALFERRLSPEDAARAEEHVDGCATCRALVARLAAMFGRSVGDAPYSAETMTEPEVPQPPPEDPLPLGVGDVVDGKLRIDKLIGRGGMGIVY